MAEVEEWTILQGKYVGRDKRPCQLSAVEHSLDGLCRMTFEFLSCKEVERVEELSKSIPFLYLRWGLTKLFVGLNPRSSLVAILQRRALFSEIVICIDSSLRPVPWSLTAKSML